jgi:hypothetical protein
MDRIKVDNSVAVFIMYDDSSAITDNEVEQVNEFYADNEISYIACPVTNEDRGSGICEVTGLWSDKLVDLEVEYNE